MVLTVKADLLLITSHLKNIWPTSVSQNRREVVYMRRINYDSVTVNISVFIQQRNISFQNDISLKNHKIGSLIVRKVQKIVRLITAES